MSFRRISYIAEHPSFICQIRIDVSNKMSLSEMYIKGVAFPTTSCLICSPQEKNNQFGKLVFAHVDLKEDVFALGKCILLPEPVQEHPHQFMLLENMGFMHSTLDTTQVSTALCLEHSFLWNAYNT